VTKNYWEAEKVFRLLSLNFIFFSVGLSVSLSLSLSLSLSFPAAGSFLRRCSYQSADATFCAVVLQQQQCSEACFAKKHFRCRSADVLDLYRSGQES
jgi:hypothetical protein